MNDIQIQYNGRYPNLCSGQLIVTINGVRWVFPSHCMCSGGSVWFDKNWSEHIESGDWNIDNWPEGFPEDMKKTVIEAVNNEVSPGCCGGCV